MSKLFNLRKMVDEIQAKRKKLDYMEAKILKRLADEEARTIGQIISDNTNRSDRPSVRALHATKSTAFGTGGLENLSRPVVVVNDVIDKAQELCPSFADMTFVQQVAHIFQYCDPKLHYFIDLVNVDLPLEQRGTLVRFAQDARKHGFFVSVHEC